MFREVLAEIRKDWPFYAVIAGYTVVCFGLSVWIGAGHNFVPFIYIHKWLRFTSIILAPVVLVWAVQALRTPAPGETLLRTVRERCSARWIAGMAMFLSLALFHGVFTSAKTILPYIAPFEHDQFLANLDAALHGQDPWLYLRFLDPITDWIQGFYGILWLLFLVLVSMAACTFARLEPVRRQYLWTFFICWILLGNIIAGIGMSAGPILYENVLGDPRFAGLVDNIQLHADKLNSAATYRERLWLNYTQRLAGEGSGISAFPSLHLSMATLFWLTMRQLGRPFSVLFGAVLVLTMIGSVHLGWHYAVDGYFSILATLAIWWAVGALSRLPAPRRYEAAAVPAE